MERVTDDDIIRAIEICRGWLAFAARRLNMTEEAIRRRAETSQRVATAIHEAEALLDDIAAQKLFEAVETGKLSAISIYLRERQTERAAAHDGTFEQTRLTFDKDYYDNDAHDRAAAGPAAPAPDPSEPGPI